jgi:hypothetical protein
MVTAIVMDRGAFLRRRFARRSGAVALRGLWTAMVEVV